MESLVIETDSGCVEEENLEAGLSSPNEDKECTALWVQPELVTNTGRKALESRSEIHRLYGKKDLNTRRNHRVCPRSA
jgi:hypothetical protein